jgi:hypothetical protein
VHCVRRKVTRLDVPAVRSRTGQATGDQAQRRLKFDCFVATDNACRRAPDQHAAAEAFTHASRQLIESRSVIFGSEQEYQVKRSTKGRQCRGGYFLDRVFKLRLAAQRMYSAWSLKLMKKVVHIVSLNWI